ncbi:Asp23/Gls24 family envelope stress response protein [Streptomyces sp. AJS327]|uniref:Asp23/Gls24 family envelope stress response protein n=1 Tax=Streptomyces sp. AJS327 TaxID=2545265 RepID=UPI0015DE2197|nr:Asp23/Gls24 family envelope stress response protein [Streptomyces sp. AJS327]MBA0050493.1 Asp23/Gls24 family envelope stress response protein [Streptomyces sp. AJS327]
MSDTAQRGSSGTSSGKESRRSGEGGGGSGGPGERGGGGPPAERGRTSIADGVVEKIAGMAAREVPGVHAMGAGMARTLGAVRDRVPGGGRSVQRGVKAEVGEVQTALDTDIVVDYGVSIDEVARAVRENVIRAVERMTGLEVVEVNIAVGDVKLPEEDGEENDDQRRLQ